MDSNVFKTCCRSIPEFLSCAQFCAKSALKCALKSTAQRGVSRAISYNDVHHQDSSSKNELALSRVHRGPGVWLCVVCEITSGLWPDTFFHHLYEVSNQPWMLLWKTRCWNVAAAAFPFSTVQGPPSREQNYTYFISIFMPQKTLCSIPIYQPLSLI